MTFNVDAPERDDLAPANATAFERAQSQTSARLLDTDTDAIRRARTAKTAPKPLLNHLAWERSVHHPSSDEAIMRVRTDNAFIDHLSYGSPAALEDEISEDTGQRVGIVECFEDTDLQWPDFIVQAEIYPGEPPPNLDALFQAAIRRKNVRDWPAKVRTFVRQPSGHCYFGAAMCLSIRQSIMSQTPDLIGLHIGAAARLIVKTRIS